MGGFRRRSAGRSRAAGPNPWGEHCARYEAAASEVREETTLSGSIDCAVPGPVDMVLRRAADLGAAVAAYSGQGRSASGRGVDKWGSSGSEWGEVAGKDSAPETPAGTHDHTIDDKSRLTLPAKFRRAFEGGVVVTRGLGRPAPRRLSGGTSGADQPQPYRRPRLAQRRGPESPVRRRRERRRGRPGQAGRNLIPSALREYAGLDRDVVAAGVNDHLEIWDRAAWRRELAESEGRTRDVAERLAAQRD